MRVPGRSMWPRKRDPCDRSGSAVSMKLSIFLGMIVVCTAVGLGADALGCSFFTSFLLSGVGAMAGVWLGWWLHRRYFG